MLSWSPLTESQDEFNERPVGHIYAQNMSHYMLMDYLYMCSFLSHRMYSYWSIVRVHHIVNFNIVSFIYTFSILFTLNIN